MMSDIIVPLDPKLIVAWSCPATTTVYRLALVTLVVQHREAGISR